MSDEETHVLKTHTIAGLRVNSCLDLSTRAVLSPFLLVSCPPQGEVSR